MANFYKNIKKISCVLAITAAFVLHQPFDGVLVSSDGHYIHFGNSAYANQTNPGNLDKTDAKKTTKAEKDAAKKAAKEAEKIAKAEKAAARKAAKEAERIAKAERDARTKGNKSCDANSDEVMLGMCALKCKTGTVRNPTTLQCDCAPGTVMNQRTLACEKIN